jgi:serine O-acetyltransferase
MEYRYDGDAHERLFATYDDDTEPFPTSVTACFPERNHRREEIELLQELLFPTCWNSPELVRDELAVLDHLDEFGELFRAGICPYSDGNTRPRETVSALIDSLPRLRRVLKRDVEAAYKGDPAAKTYMEIIRSYPGFLAIAVQRVAHVLYDIGAEEYARELTEYAKTRTGIDIHPGAEIGEHFFIDHGTGVVIGESTTVGEWVRRHRRPRRDRGGHEGARRHYRGRPRQHRRQLLDHGERPGSDEGVHQGPPDTGAETLRRLTLSTDRTALTEYSETESSIRTLAGRSVQDA